MSLYVRSHLETRVEGARSAVCGQWRGRAALGRVGRLGTTMEDGGGAAEEDGGVKVHLAGVGVRVVEVVVQVVEESQVAEPRDNTTIPVRKCQKVASCTLLGRVISLRTRSQAAQILGRSFKLLLMLLGVRSKSRADKRRRGHPDAQR